MLRHGRAAPEEVTNSAAACRKAEQRVDAMEKLKEKARTAGRRGAVARAAGFGAGDISSPARALQARRVS
jgi:hypothetical protein